MKDFRLLLYEGDMRGGGDLYTAKKKNNEHRNTTRKVNETESSQHVLSAR